MFIKQLSFVVLAFSLVIANPVQTFPVEQLHNIPLEIPVVLQQPTSNTYSFSSSIPPHDQTTISTHALQTESSDNVSQIVIEKILSNPTLQALLNPAIYKQNSNANILGSGTAPTVINNYIIIPSEYLKLNKSAAIEGKKDGDILKETSQTIKRKKSKNPKRKQSHGLDNSSKDIYLEELNVENLKPKNRLERQEHAHSKFDGIIAETNFRENTMKKDNIDLINLETNTENVTQIGHGIPISEKQNAYTENTEKPKRKRKRNRSKSTNISNTSIPRSESNNFATKNKIKFQTFSTAPPPGPMINQTINTISNSNSIQNDQQHQNIHITQKLKEEAEIQLLRRKYPQVPEEMIRNLLLNIKHQLHREQSQLGLPPFTYPNAVFSEIYRDFYQRLPYSYSGFYDRSKNVNKPKKTKRRNSKRSRKQKQSDVAAQNKSSNRSNNRNITHSLNDNEHEKDEKSTELLNPNTNSITISSVEKNESKFFKPLAKIDGHASESTKDEAEKKAMKGKTDYDLSLLELPEIGSEDELPNIFDNGLIADYYPNFTADNKVFIQTDGKYSPRNLREDRYFHTTDKNIRENDLEPYKGGKDDNLSYKTLIVTSADRPKDNKKINKGQNVISNDFLNFNSKETEEIQFQIPPSLEKPDFFTRKIDKESINSVTYNPESYPNSLDDYKIFDYNEYTTDKLSTYSPVKRPEYNIRVKPANEIERIKVHSKNKMPKNDEIVTVYAQSKVANYGKNVT